jgi:hypothetical protein
VPTIDLPNDEFDAVTAAIPGVTKGDRYPHASWKVTSVPTLDRSAGREEKWPELPGGTWRSGHRRQAFGG